MRGLTPSQRCTWYILQLLPTGLQGDTKRQKREKKHKKWKAAFLIENNIFTSDVTLSTLPCTGKIILGKFSFMCLALSLSSLVLDLMIFIGCVNELRDKVLL